MFESCMLYLKAAYHIGELPVKFESCMLYVKAT